MLASPTNAAPTGIAVQTAVSTNLDLNVVKQSPQYRLSKRYIYRSNRKIAHSKGSTLRKPAMHLVPFLLNAGLHLLLVPEMSSARFE